MISVSKSLNATLRSCNCTHVSTRWSQCHSELLLFFGHAWLAGTACCRQSHCKARSNSINYNTFPAVLEMSWVPASASPCWLKVSWPSGWELPFLVVSARSPIGDPQSTQHCTSTDQHCFSARTKTEQRNTNRLCSRSIHNLNLRAGEVNCLSRHFYSIVGRKTCMCGIK